MCILFGIGRMCDIWASFISQRILRELDSYLFFSGPTVNHVRNEHNLVHDLFEETLGLKYTTKLLKFLNEIKFKKNQNVLDMYKVIVDKMLKLEFINNKMNKFQNHWLDDVSKYY